MKRPGDRDGSADWLPRRSRRAGAWRRATPLFALLWLVLSVGQAAHADEAKAKQLYSVGEGAFSGGRYAEAARAFEGAFAESHHPSLLWNVAQSYHRQYDLDGDVVDLKRAAAVYRNYLELLPEGADRGEVNAALAVVQKQIEAAARPAPVEKPPVAPPAPVVKEPLPLVPVAAPPEAPPKRKWGLWIGLGVGAGLIVAGTAIGLGVGLGSKTVEQGLMPGNVAPGFQRITP